MSESGDGGPGRREVAHRLFAAEFDDAEFSYSESDEERAPNYVVTPTGARVNRLFAVGVLTELEQVNDEVLRARVVDPTGPFVVYAGQYQPEALAFLEAATPPLFVAVTGKARTFEPEDGDRVFTSVRPESISEVDAETRDRWVVQAAEQTVARVDRTASARQSGLSGDTLRQALVAAGVSESDAAGAALALDHYDTTGDYLQAVRDLALNAARVVAGERDEAGTLSLSPGDGGDDSLGRLATMTLEAPGETPTVETDADEPTVGDASPEADEPSGTAGEPTTADTSTESEPSTPIEAESSTDSGEPVETDTDAEPSTETTSEPSTPAVGTDAETTSEPTADAESPSARADADEGSSDTLGDFDSDTTVSESASTVDTTESETDSDSEVGDFDTEFELDEDEREEIESEYGTDFQSGTEVDDAGEAGIETPDPEELAEAEAAAEADDAGDTETAGASETDTVDEAASEPAEDVDLEDAVMDVMADHDDGSGADREAVLTEVMDAYGADREAVEDAIQDALMGGRCYEPDDGKLTPI